MKHLDNFMELLCGNFDNQEQFEEMRKKGEVNFPYAKHINTICNDKIENLPEAFDDIFMIEESYYTVNGKTNAQPHLFCFSEEGDVIKLTSYELPQGYTKENFSYINIEKKLDYLALKSSENFTPAIYEWKAGVWEGGSTSMFTPVLKFILHERFSKEMLEVNETMELNGKRTFGYDVPIIYKRVNK